MRIIRNHKFGVVFTIFCILTLVYAVLYLSTTKQVSMLPRSAVSFDDSWLLTEPNGNTLEVTLPVSMDYPEGAAVTLTKSLPEKIAEGTYFIVRDYNDVKIYVDDALRFQFLNAEDVDISGGITKGIYMFCPLHAEDAGKELKVVYDGASENGDIPKVLYGDSLGVVEYAFNRDLPFYIGAMVLCMVSVLVIAASLVLWDRDKHGNARLFYVAVGVFLMALWMVLDCPLFQFVFRVRYIDGTLSFLVTLLTPYPYIRYMNALQERRYAKVQRLCIIASFFFFVLFSTLHFAGIVNFRKMILPIDLCLAFIVCVEIVLVILDLRAKKVSSYRYTLIGLVCLFVSILGEFILLNLFFDRTDGAWILVGLYLLLFLCAIQQVVDTKVIRRELLKKTEEISCINLSTIITIANMVDAKEKYTSGHSVMVAKCARDIANRLGFSYVELQKLYNVALLHDIGKITVPEYILNKPGTLNKAEFEVMKEHSTYGGDILKENNLLEHVQEGVRYHHERWDGTGYPDGLKGEEIPLFARIICIADSYDAMSRMRSYCLPMSRDEIIEEFTHNAGTQFDPKLAHLFVDMLKMGYDIKAHDDDLNAKEDLSFEARLLNQVVNEYTYDMNLLAETDNLTGLLGNSFMKSEINKLLASEMGGALIMIDIDNFKQINDTFGHVVGDLVLKELSEVLRAVYRHDDLLARMGGDEFAIFMRGCTEEAQIRKHAEDIRAKFGAREALIPYREGLSISVGIAIAPEHGRIMDELYEAADAALYSVKRGSKNGLKFYQS